MNANLIAAVLIGFSSSAHCIFMCGGIAASFRGSEQSRHSPQLLGLTFHLGRLCSYAVIGFLFGLLIQSASGIMDLGIWLRIFAGLMLIAMGLYLTNIWRGLSQIERVMEPVWRPISNRLKSHIPAKKLSDALIVGLCWGWLPCGLVYSTLVWASSSGSALESSMLMFAMGLGSLPALLGVGLVGNLLRRKATVKLSGLALCLFGLWTLAMPVSSVLGLSAHGAHGSNGQHPSLEHQPLEHQPHEPSESNAAEHELHMQHVPNETRALQN